ncbi:MAG: MFS transporter [candidate division WOR-3 bacterium]|nr:MFS transporter [candidate division WOR-3 bacterium]
MKESTSSLQNRSAPPQGGRRNLYLLSFVSFFTDLSTEMIYPLVPGFIRSLGGSNLLVGVIEGIAESTAALGKAAFGWLSDRLRHRKLFVLAGYTVSTISKPFLGLAGHWGEVLALRFAERMGKGLRTPARDALLSESISKKRRGLGFGFHRAMDNLGAAGGPLLAVLVLYIFNGNVRMVFLLSVIPALVAVSLIFFVREIRTLKRTLAEAKRSGPLSSSFKWFAAVIVIFTLGNSSNAFLLLRAQDAGITQQWVPLLWALYSLVGALASPLFGALSDRIGRRTVIFISFLVYAAIYFLFGRFASPLAMWLLFAGYGVYLGLSKGVFRAFIADMVQPERRATAYGIFETAIGLTLLPASLLFGFLWDTFSARLAFSVGAGLALAAALVFLITQTSVQRGIKG